MVQGFSFFTLFDLHSLEWHVFNYKSTLISRNQERPDLMFAKSKRKLIMNSLKEMREILKDSLRKKTDFSRTDQHRGLPPPPVQKPADPALPRFSLPGPDEWQKAVSRKRLDEIISSRKSRRSFSAQPMSLEQLAFLLWATQGVRRIPGKGAVLRHVPSAGARHSFETYLFVFNVSGLDPGLYRFLPLDEELVLTRNLPDMGLELAQAAFSQRFVSQGAVTFVWACIPYRMEWRYGPTSYRVILLDAGHVCQNLYLACEALGAGTCAVAAYDQEALDQLLGVDGIDEFAVYLAPVGIRN